MQSEIVKTLEPGDTLDHYRLEAIIAHSGMSTLFRARDLNSGKLVALKVPLPEMEAARVLLERYIGWRGLGRDVAGSA